MIARDIGAFGATEGEMGRTLKLVAMCALVILSIEPAPAADKMPSPGDTILHLSARAARMVTPDQLHAVLVVQTNSDHEYDNPYNVQDDINRRMAAALERVHRTPSVKSIMGGLNVHRGGGKSASKKWRGSQTLTLTSTAPIDLLSLASELERSGLVTEGFAYQLSRESQRKFEDELTTEAITELRRRAGLIAAALGVAVRGVRDVVIVSADTETHRKTESDEELSSYSASAVGERGEIEVSVTAQAEVLLAPVKR
jgi:predicted secreted protein